MEPQLDKQDYKQFLKKRNQMLINKAQNILICGAGPVGLITAIQISLNYPQKKIFIIDLIRRFQNVKEKEKEKGKWKNLQYPEQMKQSNQIFSRRRGQVVTIRDDCRDLIPFFKDILLQKFLNRVWGASTNVPLRQLEDVLMQYVQSSKFTNIQLQFDENGSANIKQILNKQKFDLVIGCDGAGSRVRQQLAPQPSINNLNSDCVIEGKRYIFGRDYVLGAYVDQNMEDYRIQNKQMTAGEELYHYHALLTITQMRFLLNAYYPPVSQNNQEKGIRGFLNVRLSEDEYKQLKKAGKTVGVKCNFVDPALTTTVWRQNQRGLLNLKQTQRSILTSAFNYYGLRGSENCGFIYLFQLRPGYSSQFGFTYQNKDKKQIPIFLCGDAAISHHFWPGRGLNAGIKSVSFLLNCLCYPKKQAIQNYNSNMKRLAQREIIERSFKFCQFNGKGQRIPNQMSLFDQKCGENKYIDQDQTGAINPQQRKKWRKNIYTRILQLTEVRMRRNGQTSAVWPNLSLSSDQQKIQQKLSKIDKTFNEHFPRIFRYIINSGRWYLQGTQPEVFSLNKKQYIFQIFHLGYCYQNGYGVQKDYKKAVQLYTKSAQQGNSNAQNNLGLCYHNGYGVQKDYKKAVQLYRKSAQQGNQSAQYNLGYCYYNGQGVQKDYKKAVQLYTKSAQQGNQSAQNSLGLCYINGLGVQKDYKKAVQLYTKSAQQGNSYAQNSLGLCYHNGYGVQKDYKKAVQLYTKSAQQGNSNAQNNLGLCYYNGYDVQKQKDYLKALQLYRKNPQLGDYKAQFNLVVSHRNRVKKDYKKAVQLYRKSAQQGNQSARNNLGSCYINGYGVQKDYKKAVQLYTKSTQQGYLYYAQNNLRLLNSPYKFF